MNLSTVHRTKSLCDDGGRKVARMKTMLGPNLLMSPTVGAQHGALSRLSVTSHNNWYSNKIYKRVDTCSCPWLLFSGLRWFTFNVLLYMYLSILVTCGQNKSNILTCWWLMCKHPKQQVQLHRISTWTQHMLVYSTAVNIKLWNITHTASSVLWLLTKYVEFDMSLLKWNQWIRPSGSVTSLKAQRGKWCTDWEDDSCVRKQNLLDVVIQSNLLQ